MICDNNNENQPIIQFIDDKRLLNKDREFLYMKAFYEEDGVTPKKNVSLIDFESYMNTFPNVINIKGSE